ncbi:uncharacterized protein PFL1_01771 [Pseudozyma flocculosa PF-1]|uniref:Uncharacterized protein n=1 Tax=Pseudozyma flocculosa TaxID=84751 RepID=A0A5C3EXE6_9BASI|nr:uncharacterized protein PFL1_01771 [Pseudozyma flocculosa PF-1]EPQ30874.1 hypothetical protein PFL1_01771 [Pseudozyma flocculosa PF-1]SPO36752.1 uncharacterized protein PSFLO_02223 [Pseudozyma flocculosa]
MSGPTANEPVIVVSPESRGTVYGQPATLVDVYLPVHYDAYERTLTAFLPRWLDEHLTLDKQWFFVDVFKFEPAGLAGTPPPPLSLLSAKVLNIVVRPIFVDPDHSITAFVPPRHELVLLQAYSEQELRRAHEKLRATSDLFEANLLRPFAYELYVAEHSRLRLIAIADALNRDYWKWALYVLCLDAETYRDSLLA